MADNNRRGSSQKGQVEASEERVDTQRDSLCNERDYVCRGMSAAIDQIVDDGGGPLPFELPHVNSQFVDMLKDLTQVDSKYSRDPTESGGVKHPEIEKLHVIHKKSFKDNYFGFKAAEAVALGTFQAAWYVWQQARHDYSYAIESAQADLQLAAEQALEVYTDKWSADSPVQNSILYTQFEAAVAVALTTYQGVAADAGATLAGQAGTMLTAYAALISTGQQAELAQISSDITAEATFWESVQTLRSS